jgi:ribosomal protein S12 methylthiotransferase
MFVERYRPDLEKKFLMWINILERLNYLLLKALGADYKHELLGERLTQNYAYLKCRRLRQTL